MSGGVAAAAAEADAETGRGAPPRRKRLTTKVLLVVCSINLIDCINTTLLVPYVDAFVSSLLGKERGDPDVAGWVTLLVGSYSVCEVVFSGLWGALSDRWGRRPVLLLGLAGSAVAPILFGLSQSLPAALGARLLDGFFCGNVGVTRTYLGELADPSNEARAFGSLASAFSVGLLIGPALGGLLVEPAAWAPGIFAGTVFDRYPYFLPNLTYACFAVAALVLGACSLEETRNFGACGARSARAVLLDSQAGGEGQAEGEPSRLARPQVWTPGLKKLVLAICLLFGYISARLQGCVLITSFPRSLGGLAFGPKVFGYMQMLSAIVQFLTQAFLFEPGLRRFGPHRCFVCGLSATILVTLPFPLYCSLSDPDRYGLWRYVPVMAWQTLSQIAFYFCFPVIFMLINRECTEDSRGTVNGWVQSMTALTRGAFPFAAGALVKFGERAESARPWSLPGGRYLVLYANLFPALASVWLVGRQGRQSPTCDAAARPSGDNRGSSAADSALADCGASGDGGVASGDEAPAS